MSEPADSRLDVRQLSVTLAQTDVNVVADVSFQVEAGEMLGVVGESGSGKSTVALALLGYARRGLQISTGQVRINGSDVLSLSVAGRRELRGRTIAYVPQDPASALNPGLTVGTQLREVLRSDEERRDGDRRLAEVIDEVGLSVDQTLAAYPHQLSGGQQQRVLLAMAFALRPRVIVLDEPTTGLDVTTQRRVLDTIRSLCAAHGVAGVFVSHDLAVVGELVDHVAVMYAGQIIELGRETAVLRTPRHPYTRALLRAVPEVDRAANLVGIDGRPPDPEEALAGCRFAPRCPYVQPRCQSADVELRRISMEDRRVRCVRAGEALAADDASETPTAMGANRARADSSRLRIRNLSAHYGVAQVLFDINLDLENNECIALVGESGSGKTTLARCIVGLHRRWTGEVMIHERMLRQRTRERARSDLRALQYVFQNPYSSLNPRKTVHQSLEQGIKQFSDAGRAERARRVTEALEAVALDPSFRHRYPSELSGGERQRAAIARCLVVEPEILVCDEVTSALDVSVQAAIVGTLRDLQTKRGLALLFITHNLALVRSIAQRTFVMQGGRVVESGDTDELLTRPVAPYTKQLLADLPRAVGDNEKSTKTSLA